MVVIRLTTYYQVVLIAPKAMVMIRNFCKAVLPPFCCHSGSIGDDYQWHARVVSTTQTTNDCCCYYWLLPLSLRLVLHFRSHAFTTTTATILYSGSTLGSFFCYICTQYYVLLIFFFNWEKIRFQNVLTILSYTS